MGHGQGVEHFQVPAAAGLFHGTDAVTEWLVKGKFTSNQLALAACLSLGTKGPLHSVSQAEEFFAGQITYGHMSSGPDGVKRNEIFAPAPHSILWGLPLSLLGLWAPDGPLRTSAVNWWATRFILTEAFWVPGVGVRAPCGRFLWPRDTDPIPDWTVWSVTYARFKGLSEDGLGHAHDVTFDAYDAMLHRLGVEIRAVVAQAPVPIVAVPIKRWVRDGGGYFAAFDGTPPLAPPMNDPLAWVEVDGTGRVVNAGKGLDSLPEMIGVPTVIGRAAGRVGDSSDSSLSPIQSPPAISPPVAPPPTTPIPLPVSGRDPKMIAADILRLQVASRDRSTLREIAMEVTGAIRQWRTWDETADDLLSLGPGHEDVKRLAEEVRGMVT